MRIFVVCTGRCGSVTFSKACSHIENYSVGHESHNGIVGNFCYADNHIEVDPRLAYHLPILMQKYPDALYIFLRRERKSCIESLAKRKSLVHYAKFHFGATKNLERAAEIYYDNTNLLIEKLLAGKCVNVWLEKMETTWPKIWKMIKAEGDFEKSWKEWQVKYNES